MPNIVGDKLFKSNSPLVSKVLFSDVSNSCHKSFDIFNQDIIASNKDFLLRCLRGCTLLNLLRTLHLLTDRSLCTRTIIEVFSCSCCIRCNSCILSRRPCLWIILVSSWTANLCNLSAFRLHRLIQHYSLRTCVINWSKLSLMRRFFFRFFLWLLIS